MSAFGGIFNLGDDPRPINENLLDELGNHLDPYGPDAGSEVVFANLGMTYRAFRTTRESHFEYQPLTTPQGHVLVWNGRLDNRQELLRQLRQDLKNKAGTIGDVEIVMAAYLKWGGECFVRLIGDFCLALWDDRRRALHLVPDIIGARALYFHANPNHVYWSTHLAPLVQVFGIRIELDEEYIAGQLTRIPEPGLTPYKEIHAVKPGHVLTVCQNGRVTEQRYWSLYPKADIRYRRDEQYVAHFLHEFRDAVRCRLRSDRPVFAELSGGLDSSSIVCMADQILGSERVQTPLLETISQVFDESPTADERKFIRLVEEQRGMPGHYIFEDEYRTLGALPGDFAIVTPNPAVLTLNYLDGLRAAMRESNARVLLSGRGGDELLGSNYSAYPEVADHLRSFKLLLLHHRLQSWSEALKKPYLQLFWKNALIPLMPRKVQTVFNRTGTASLPPWFSQSFIKRANLRERNLGTQDPFGFRLPSERDQSSGFASMVRSISLGCRNELTDIDITFPFLHRPLVEFLQAVPVEQLLRPGENRSLMRRAMRGILPDKIAERKTKGNPKEVVVRALMREWPRLRPLFEDARVCARGYMDQQPLLAALDRAKHGCEPLSTPLLSAICLELWLRAFEEWETTPRQVHSHQDVVSITDSEVTVSLGVASQASNGANHKPSRSHHRVRA
jgi:asparagine synthase (glutamine-hydrolysing)